MDQATFDKAIELKNSIEVLTSLLTNLPNSKTVSINTQSKIKLTESLKEDLINWVCDQMNKYTTEFNNL